MTFSVFFVGILIKAALATTAVSAVVLITLLVIDFRKGKVW